MTYQVNAPTEVSLCEVILGKSRIASELIRKPTLQEDFVWDAPYFILFCSASNHIYTQLLYNRG